MTGSRNLPGKLRLNEAFGRCGKGVPRSKAKRYPKSASMSTIKIERYRQRDSEIGRGRNGNLYIKLDLFSHKLAATHIRSQLILYLKRFTRSSKMSSATLSPPALKTFSVIHVPPAPEHCSLLHCDRLARPSVPHTVAFGPRRSFACLP